MKRADRVRLRGTEQWGIVLRVLPGKDAWVRWDDGLSTEVPPEALVRLADDAESHTHHWVPRKDGTGQIQACACGATYRFGQVIEP